MRAALFGFGLERLGLWAARRPALALALLALITALAIAGLPRLGFNSDIREVFRSSGESSAILDRATQAFGASEHDLFVVIEGEDLFTPERLTAMRDFALDLRLIEGLAIPREELEFQLSYYNSATYWIDIDAMLKVFGLERADLIGASRATTLSERMSTTG